MKDKPSLPADWEPTHRRPHGKFDLRIPGFSNEHVVLFFPKPPLDRVAPETESMAARELRLRKLEDIGQRARRYMRAVRADYSKPAPDELELVNLARSIIALNYDCAHDLGQLLAGDKWKGLFRGYLAVLIRRKR